MRQIRKKKTQRKTKRDKRKRTNKIQQEENGREGR